MTKKFCWDTQEKFNIEVFGLDYQTESKNVVKAKYNDKNLIKLKNTSQEYPFKKNTFDYVYISVKINVLI